jgi:2-phospho-L-lactate guanylyltransferase
MPVFAVVPVQRLDRAKSRLSPVLSGGQRRRLVMALLSNVLRALTNASTVDRVIVVSPDIDVLARARDAGAVTLMQRGDGLNDAIRLGRDLALQQEADTLLVVLADLPYLTSQEVDQLLSLACEASVTLAPDRHGRGTNALVLRPPDAIEPSFGIDSFLAHRGQATRRDRSHHVYNSRGTAFDVDTSDDLTALGSLAEYLGQSAERAPQDSRPSAQEKIVPSHHFE